MPYDQAPYGLEMATVLITQRLLEALSSHSRPTDMN